MTRQDAFMLRARYAATHSVTKGFHSPLHDCDAPLPTLGACTHCGRGYVMLGTKPECWTCGGKTFAAFNDQPTCPASATAAESTDG